MILKTGTDHTATCKHFGMKQRLIIYSQRDICRVMCYAARLLSDISGSHDGEYGDECLLGHCAMYSRVDDDRGFRGTYCFPDDGSNKHLRNVVNFYEIIQCNIS
jgi:hypothetical protein